MPIYIYGRTLGGGTERERERGTGEGEEAEARVLSWGRRKADSVPVPFLRST